jgi:hypothetical protein
VQLEFKPSMEDELELKSGQLVRMLHEYDDGWVSSFHTTYLLQTCTNFISRHSAQRWTAARRVLSHAHVFPRCPSSLAARHLKMAPRLPDPMAWPHRHPLSTAPWHLAHSLPTSQPNRAAHALPLSKVSRHASPCQARLFRLRATFTHASDKRQARATLPSLTTFTFTQAKHGSPLFFFFLRLLVFLFIAKGSVKTPATGLRYLIFFSFLGTTRGGVVLRFGCLLRCLHKTSLACDLAGIDSSLKLNLRAGC